MSLYYQHLLVPEPNDVRPSADKVAAFIGLLVEERYVPAKTELSFAEVLKTEPVAREQVNPFTGNTIRIPGKSRKQRKAEPCSTIDELLKYAEKASEYNVALSAVGIPPRPPTAVGYVECDSWKPMDEPYSLEIRCCVRSSIVRVYSTRSPDDHTKVIDVPEFPAPIFDEDCAAEEGVGRFVHPETGPIYVPNAGCAMFWVEFNYGKMIFPRLNNGGIDVLDDRLLRRAEDVFGVNLVQACNWA